MATSPMQNERSRSGPLPGIARPAASASMRLIPVIILFYSTLLPQEVRLIVADQVIYPYRAATFILFPWLLHAIVTGKFPFRPADLLMFVAVIWMVVSFVAFYGAADGISRGGILALDTIAPYLITRLCVRSFDDLRRLLVIAAPGLLAAGISMMIESVTHRQLIRPAAAAVFGPLPFFENGQAAGGAKDFNVIRLGLLRAAGPFSHPILAGLYMASFVPLYFTSSLIRWPRKVGLVAGIMSFFSVSSAAILSLGISFFLLVFDRLQAAIQGVGWRFMLYGVTMGLMLVQVASQHGVVPILIRYTLDPQTGYFRQLIWQYGSISVAKHPWFGIGFTDYERLPWMINSIDNHWLLLGVRHGYITPFALFGSCIYGIILVARTAERVGGLDRNLCVGLGIALTGLVLNGFTTSYFGGTLTWFMMMIALCYSVVPHPSHIQTRTLKG